MDLDRLHVAPITTPVVEYLADLNFRPIYVDRRGYIWGVAKDAERQLTRYRTSDFSDRVAAALLPGGESNSVQNIIAVNTQHTVLAAYVTSTNAATAGFYLIDNSNADAVTLTRKVAAMPNGWPYRGTQTMASADDGLNLWAGSYGEKVEANPPNTIYRSTDGGLSWALCYTHVVAVNTHIHAVAWDCFRKRVWACIGDHGGGGRPGIAYSDDYGANWTLVEEPGGAYDYSYMFTTIIPLPDRVLFGTDRTPAGIVQWKPISTDAQPAVLTTDIAQVYAAQATGTSNLGFSLAPAIDLSRPLPTIMLGFGHSAAYSRAFSLLGYGGNADWWVMDHNDDPAHSNRWVKTLAGVTHDGYVIGETSEVVGDEWVVRIQVPGWRLTEWPPLV